MIQPAACGDSIRYIACLPPHICLNEVMLSTTYTVAMSPCATIG